MLKLWQLIGVTLFWLAWPAFWLLSPRRAPTRVLLTSGTKVLVVKSLISSGRWGLPGGGLHRGEDVRDGALRELYEETGIRLEPSQLTPLFDKWTHEFGLRAPNNFFCAELPKVS